MFISKAIFFLLMIYFHNISTHEARSFPNINNNDITINLSSQFSEAPNYRNALHCPTLDKNDMSYSLSCNPSAIHIAMTIDSQYLRGSIASVNSILTHSSCPENLFFHFIASDDHYYTNTLKSTFPSLHFKLYIFDESKVNALISSSIRKALDTPLNYARTYLAELLDTCVSRVIYLDSDTIVVDDIAELWAAPLTAAGSSSRAVAAPEYCGANFRRYFTDEFWSDPELSEALKGKKACYFNTGVMVVDLGQWRERDYTEKIEGWMRIQKERRIYELGSLPPFLLVFGGEVGRVDHRWNQHGLGGDNVVNSCRSLHEGPVSLMHWSGKGKPWVRLDSGQPCPVDYLWAPYDLYRH